MDSAFPMALVIFFVFIFDFYIESFCLAKLEALTTGKIGSMASFLCAVVVAFLWDQPWAWTMHEWHHGSQTDSHRLSAGAMFCAFFFVLGESSFFTDDPS